MSVADLLRQMRDGADLSQYQLVERLGIRQGSVSVYENGHRVPGSEIFLRWLVACGCEIRDPDGRKCDLSEWQREKP